MNEIDNAIGIVREAEYGRKLDYSVHEKRVTKKINFAVTPPLTARTFSFITSTQPSNSKVLGTDRKRRNLFIQNLGADSVFLSIGSQAGFDGANFSDSIEIPAGVSYEFPANSAPINDVYVVSSAATLITVMEAILA